MNESNHKVSIRNRSQGRQGDQRGQAGGIAEELGKGGKSAQGNEGCESGQRTKKNQRETEEGMKAVENNMNDKPKDGDIQVWNVINPPSEPRRYPVKSLIHAKELTDTLVAQQLSNPNVHSNAFGLEVFANGEWEEWYDEDTGVDFSDWCEELDDKLKSKATG